MSPHVPDPAPRRPRLLRRAALLVATAAAALAFTHALAAIATTEGRLEPDGHAARTAERLAAEAQRDVTFRRKLYEQLAALHRDGAATPAGGAT